VTGEGLEDLLAVGLVRLVARRAERRRWRGGDAFQKIVGNVVELDEFIVDDAADAVAGAQELIDQAVLLDLADDADKRLIDDRSGPARLTDDGVSFCSCHKLTFLGKTRSVVHGEGAARVQ